jgi:hypothetical protein
MMRVNNPGGFQASAGNAPYGFLSTETSSKVQFGGNCKGPIKVSHAILKS